VSNLKIFSIQKPTAAQYERLEKNCSYATFTHTRLWTQIFCTHPNPHFNNRIPSDASLFFNFSDGVEMLFPMVQYAEVKGLFKLHSAAADQKNGGYLSESDVSEEHEELLLKYLSRYDIWWRQNPFKPVANISNGFTRQEDFNIVLDIRDGLTALRENLKKNNKEFVRQSLRAVKHGVKVDLATTLEDWQAFYQIYIESSRRWEDPKLYNWAVFEDFYKLGTDKATLWLARYEGKIVAGSIRLPHNRIVQGWIRGGLKEYFHLHAPKYLDLEVFEYYAQQNYHWFDLGWCGGDEKLMHFKMSLGGDKMDGSLLINKTRMRNTYEQLRYRAITLNTGLKNYAKSRLHKGD